MSFTTLSVVMALATLPAGAGSGPETRTETAAFSADATARLETYFHAHYRRELDLAALARQARETGRIVLTLPDGQQELALEPFSVRAPGATLVVDGQRRAFDPPATFRGHVVGVPDSQVRLSLSDDLVSGHVRRGREIVHIQPLWRFAPGAPRDAVVMYRAEDVRAEATGVADVALQAEGLEDAVAVKGSAGAAGGRILELAVEADGEFTTESGGANMVSKLVESAVSDLSALHEDNLDMQVRLSALFVFTNPATDPYGGTVYGHGPKRFGEFVGGTNPNCDQPGAGLWEQFRNHWQSDPSRTSVRRDVALLFSGKNLRLCPVAGVDAELYGTAGDSDTICGKPDRAYVVMELYPSHTAGLMAHELGHALGDDRHDDTPTNNLCDGSSTSPIMCGTVAPGSSQYSPRSLTAINDNLGAAGGCVAPPDVVLPVPAGGTYQYAAPTPPGVGRDEVISVSNAGGTPLVISNPSSLVSGACFQQLTQLQSPILPGETRSFQVRLACATSGVKFGSVSLASDDPDESPYVFTLQGEVRPGTPADVRLVAAYAPGLGLPRVTYTSTSAQPADGVRYYYDQNLGSFEQRAGGICGNGSSNATYLTLTLGGSATISGCTYRASWDSQEYTCSQGVVDTLNARTPIVINTDDYLTDTSSCQLIQPLAAHTLYDQPHFMRVTFSAGGGSYVRRVNFTKRSDTQFIALVNDTYVDEAADTSNFGQAQVIDVRAGAGVRRDGIVSANVQALGPVGSARLYFDVVGGPISNLTLYRLQGTFGWSEDTLTWSNWNAVTGGVVGSAVAMSGNAPQGSLVQFNVDSVVQGSGAWAFMLSTSDTRTGRRLGSGESPFDKPYLVVTTQR